MIKVLVIGANSYIGKKFYEFIYKNEATDMTVTMVSASNGQWENSDFSSFHTVLLLSGIVHRKEKKGMEELYNRVNHELAVKIAQKAKSFGVSQFIFMSTTSVFGEGVTCITEETVPNPTTLYGKSKLAAEKGIMELETEIFRVAIVRPPMVYGEGCRGNFTRLVKLVEYTPLFPYVENKRSMIYIDNLSEFLRKLIVFQKRGYYHPQNAEYVCTSEMVSVIGECTGRRVYCIHGFNRIIRALAGRIGTFRKLFGDCYYRRKESEDEMHYNIVGFRESIRESIDKIRDIL